MSQFDDRLKAFEAKFAQDSSLAFRLQARRDKYFALWAAELMGMDEAEQPDYIKQVISASLEEPGDDDILRKVASDLETAGKARDHNTLTAKLAELETQAKASLAEQLEG